MTWIVLVVLAVLVAAWLLIDWRRGGRTKRRLDTKAGSTGSRTDRQADYDGVDQQARDHQTGNFGL